jgi:hypothetical protein
MNQQRLHEIFEYKDGFLFRKKTGVVAGSKDTKGYLISSVDGKRQKNHRIIFMMHYGYLPRIIDHIDRNPANNKIENLRNVNYAQNSLNSGTSKHNTSGFKNVDWFASKKRWRVYLKLNGKRTLFGYFKDLELAGLVAAEAKDKYMRSSFGCL